MVYLVCPDECQCPSIRFFLKIVLDDKNAPLHVCKLQACQIPNMYVEYDKFSRLANETNEMKIADKGIKHKGRQVFYFSSLKSHATVLLPNYEQVIRHGEMHFKAPTLQIQICLNLFPNSASEECVTSNELFNLSKWPSLLLHVLIVIGTWKLIFRSH